MITRTSSPVFYIDIDAQQDPRLDSMYVSYQITNNDGFDRSDVWVNISSFQGGIVAKATYEDGLIHLGSLANSETKTAFFYLTASGETTTDQIHTIGVYDSLPTTGTLLASQDFTFTDVESTIAAQANKVNSVVSGPTPPELGGIVTVTVTGETGSIGAAKVLSFTPAADPDWRADAFELFSTSIDFAAPNDVTVTNTLLIPTVQIGATANTAYVATYLYRAVGTTTTPTAVSPIGYISSGTQIKHTGTSDFANLAPIQSAENHITLSKLVDTSSLSDGGTVTYTLRATNDGAQEVTLEQFIDTLPSSPSNVSFNSGTATYNGSAIANPSISSQTLTFVGSFVIPAGASRDLVFQATIPDVDGQYTNSAIARIGSTQIDASTDTSSNSPATASTSVGAQPPVAVDDSFTTNEDTAKILTQVDLKGNDTDPDTANAGLSVTAVSNPTNGTVLLNGDGTITFTPTANFFGTASFDYTLSDGTSTDIGHVTLTVNSVVDLTAADDGFTTNEDTPTSGTVATNDSTTSGGSLSFAKTTDPANGSVTVNANGTFTYTPNTNFHGTDTFTYTVTDAASGESLTQTVTITVVRLGRLVVGSDVGTKSQPAVKVFKSGSYKLDFVITPDRTYGVNYRGGVRVATGDFDGDSIPDIVTAPGRSKAPVLKIFSGVDGTFLRSIPAASTFGDQYIKGVYVAAGDVNGDGVTDIVVSQQLGAANVKVLAGSTNNFQNGVGSFSVIRSFNAFADFPKFLGGATVAVADINDDDKADVIVGSGSGIKATVRVFSGLDNTRLAQIDDSQRFNGVKTVTFTLGVYVSAGDVDGDGQAEIISGSSSGAALIGAGSRVRVYHIDSGDLIVSRPLEFHAFRKTDVTNVPPLLTNPNPNAGVRISVQNNRLYLVQAQDGRSQYQVRSFRLNDEGTEFDLIDSFFSASSDRTISPDFYFSGGGLFIA